MNKPGTKRRESHSDTAPGAPPPIKVAHTGVPGRVRLKVAPLYRSEPCRDALESGLAKMDGIETVRANVLTASVVVVFTPGNTLDDIVTRIAALLDIELPPGDMHWERGTRGNPEPAAAHEYYTGVLREGLANIIDFSRWRNLLRPSRPRTGAADTQAGTGRNDYYLWSIAEILAEFRTSAEKGLSDAEAERRQLQYGANLLPEPEKRSELGIFLEQFNSLPVALLGVSAVISIATGGPIDAAVIMGVVAINSVIGFFTERQAERTINALTGSAPRHATVLRSGRVDQVSAGALVPGDITILQPGSYVTADLRLLQSDRLTIDESALTGESMPAVKEVDFVGSEGTPLADRKNMAFMGTMVTGGAGRGVVVATAMATELGQIQSLVTTAEAPETPMQRQLGHMGTQLALLSGAVCAGVFVIGLLRGEGWLAMLKSSVSLAVAAVPEGLPAVATTTLALGIKQMRKRKVAVRHLDAVENLGAVQVFCLDKTGTLTRNHMSVTAVYTGGRRLAIRDHTFYDDDQVVDPLASRELRRLLETVCLCSETRLGELDGALQLEGSPTENALVELALGTGMDIAALREQCPRLDLVQRAEGRPMMLTVHALGEEKRLVAVKGSPGEVLALCSHILKDGKRRVLKQNLRNEIMLENERMAGDALRVLGIAWADKAAGEQELAENLVWLGLAGMADPLRAGMPELMRTYHRAGIRTVMITGDQSATAYAIGEQLGLGNGKSIEILDSSALDKLPPELLAGLVRKVDVFARVSPAYKLRIVQALQDAGFVVAMTGDGINDGPALKAADIGVAMGASGTDVARSVADVVLEDDNLHTMTHAVSGGRTIYNNVRKTIQFMVSTNVSEIEIMLAAIALGLGQPLNSMQLLWINLFTDIFPGLALSLEPVEPGVMRQPPRDPREE
ncbi:MAG: HAD-IC family P-type ATPase, partial [Gammaproteobacteria bacterium]